MRKIPTLPTFKRHYASLKEFVPEVAAEKLNFDKMSDFYDGPLNGILEHDGKKYWYEVVSDFINERGRYFAMLELSDREYQNEMNWHRRFTDYILQGVTANRLAWEKDSMTCEKQRKSNYKNKKVTAWFYM